MALPAGRYGVTKNQLLKIKKLPMNTIKLIEELTEKYDLLGTAAFKNSTSVVTDSTDLVESGAVYTALQDKCDNSVIAPVENGTTASQAYAVGSHAIRNGAFITWKNAKAQGETINDASDYTSGMVGDVIYIEKFHGTQTITAGNFFSEAVTLPSGYDVVMSDVVLARSGVAAYAIPKIVCTSNDKNSRTIVVLNTDTSDHTWDIYSHFILKKQN